MRRKPPDELENDGVCFVERRKRNLLAGLAFRSRRLNRRLVAMGCGDPRHRNEYAAPSASSTTAMPAHTHIGGRFARRPTESKTGEEDDGIELDVGRVLSHMPQDPTNPVYAPSGNPVSPAGAELDSPSHAIVNHPSPVFAQHVRESCATHIAAESLPRLQVAAARALRPVRCQAHAESRCAPHAPAHDVALRRSAARQRRRSRSAKG